HAQKDVGASHRAGRRQAARHDAVDPRAGACGQDAQLGAFTGAEQNGNRGVATRRLFSLVWPRGEATMLTAHVLNDRICAHSSNAADAMEVPANARLLFCNGQVGARLDGTVPEKPAEQIEVIFDRIATILDASRMTFQDIVRFTIYVTDKSLLEHYFRTR